MKQYWRSHLWDLILCFGMSASLSVNVFAGYHSPDPLTEQPWAIALVALACTLLLFLAGYDRRTTLTGIGVGVLLVIAAVVVVRGSGVVTGGSIDESPALFWLVTVVTSVVCYLLGRSRAGLAVLLLGGAIMAAAFCFLEYPVKLPAYLLFLFCAIAAFLYRVYAASLLQADSGKVRPNSYMVQSLVLVLLAVAVSGGIYAGIVRPLNPPTQELKLITRLQSLDILEKLGVSRRTEIQSPDNLTQNLDEETQTSQEQNREDEQIAPQEVPDPERESEVLEYIESLPAQAISYARDESGLVILILCLVILILALPFLLKYLFRRRWENRLRQARPADQGRELYDYFLKKLRYAGFRRPKGVTLQEYVDSNARELASFAVGEDDFPLLTRRYQKVVYGCQPLEEGEAEAFWNVYHAFRGALRKKMGTGKYLLRFFAI